MTKEAVDAVRTDHEAIVGLLETLGPREWDAASGCSGWSVKDVVIHMTTTWQAMVDPGSVPAVDDELDFERRQDRMVEALRGQSNDEVLERYRDVGKQGIDSLAGVQEVENPLELGGLGTYPLHLLANAYAFDAYTHLRADFLKPRGPLDGTAPAAGDAHMNAVVDWMIAGFPQMNREALASLGGSLDLQLDGPGGRKVTVRPGPGGVEVTEASRGSDASIGTNTTDFVLWGTKRADWKTLVEIDGNEDVAKRFCEALHVF